MFFGGQGVAFPLHQFQGSNEFRPGFRGLYHGIDITSLGCNIRIAKVIPVFLDFLFAQGFGFPGIAQFPAVDNIDSPLSTDNGDFGSRPGKYHIGAQVPGTHGDVGPSVAFSGDYRQLWHGSLRITPEELGAMTDNPSPLLLCPRKVAGNVNQGDQRDVECVASSYKPAGFVGSIEQLTGKSGKTE